MTAQGTFQVTRVYKNSNDDILRVDQIDMIPTTSITSMADRPQIQTYYRSLKIERYFAGAASRVIDSIELITGADSVEEVVSAPINYNWAEWTAEGVRCPMSDLPQIGDTV